jgi:hypothetical protein
MSAAPETIAWFRAASSYLHRDDVRCPEHRVAHTGKLARAAVLDLALLDATGDETHWRRAVERARYVASRLAPDPEHGTLIYLPGRLDPRNCSNSVIDSGECTDALGRVLLHPHAAQLDEQTRQTLRDAVAQNAETYLRTAVVEKEITNQRLWGAMGLATAWQVEPREEWRDAIRRSIARSVAEQRADGSWGYQPDAPRYGAHPGAADLTVYYHGRCLAFLLHMVERVPEVDPSGEAERAVERGLRFLAAVTLPDGTKPLALEGKRWFWDGAYEAGSNAYDVFVLLRGAARFGVPEWGDLGLRVWETLAHHQEKDGRIEATLPRLEGRRVDNFVCPDFHTADLAWTAQVMGELGEASRVGAPAERLTSAETVWRGTSPRATSASAPQSMVNMESLGVIRLESSPVVALVRTHKLPANTQFGGALAGGAIAAIARSDGGGVYLPREGEGSFILRARPGRREAIQNVRRFLKQNPPGREGRQWLFVARLLVTRGRPIAALSRLWRGYLAPLARSWEDAASAAWALASEVEEDGDQRVITATPARLDGSTPQWCAGVHTVRRIAVESDGLLVRDRLESGGVPGQRVTLGYVIPEVARHVEVSAEGASIVRTGAGGRRIAAVLPPGPCSIGVSYRL